jgi:hypothetical protein
MNFEYDIFVGYPQVSGNENQNATTWTLKFGNYLTLLMDRLSNRKPVFLMHNDLRVKQSLLGEEPARIFSNTGIFVIVLSPESVKSPEYVKELEDLYQCVYKDPDEENRKQRIIKIFTLPVSLEEQPEFLKNELSYNFFEINRFSKKPITFDLNGKSENDNKYWSKLVDLAYDITDMIDDLAGNDQRKSIRETPTVFLAETSFDQTENRDMLRRELQYLGYHVLPVLQIPEEAEKAKQAIEQCLKQSIMTIHLLGSWYGDLIKNSKFSFIDFQIKTVKDYINAKDNVHKPYQVIWIPNDIKPTDQRQVLYLKRLKRDEAQFRTEIIETPFEVFKTILNTRLDELTIQPAKPVAEKNKLYMIYEKASASKMAEYADMIQKNGFELLLHSESGNNFFPLSTHINNLLSADAVLIYKGNSTMEWLNSKIRDLVKAPGYGKIKPFRIVEIISNQKTADKSLVFLKSVPVNWDEEINHEVVQHFLEHLAKK